MPGAWRSLLLAYSGGRFFDGASQPSALATFRRKIADFRKDV
jgi:hypothetical protein